ncbi:TPA: amino acid adenylation domain-containing protein [Enterobacter cloacae]|nr:amino acid adenylation domain-containing protein [Enterobacter cloacae]
MTSPVARARCFHHVIRHWARICPEKVAFYYLPDGERVSHTLTYGDLDIRARQVAMLLQENGLTRQPVLLQFRPGTDFIIAFFGCLYAGAIAISAYPPASNRSKSDRLGKLMTSSQATTIFTNEETHDDLIREGFDNAYRVLCLEQSAGNAQAQWEEPTLKGEDIAFLQYSSGSTGDPKGVIVTHRNIMSNQQAIQEGMGNGPHTVFASWLPLFHDMGLIGNVMQPLYLGVSCWLMPPMAFLQKPARWLRLISEQGVTCTGGPDFAYRLCVDSVSEAERENLDLSRWDVAYNGAEPVRSETVIRFQQTYQAYGLRPEAVYPCYGLAEATLFVTGKGVSPAVTIELADRDKLSAGTFHPTTESSAHVLVGSGTVWGGMEVAIVEPNQLRQLDERQVGEIWLRGENVTGGYWNSPSSNEALLSLLEGDSGGKWLRSGDLGFFNNGQLFVTGRLKEVLIVRGRNHYPQDIEATIQAASPTFVDGNGVAFTDGDELVVIQEIRRSALRRYDGQASLLAARKAVADKHGLSLSRLIAVKPGTVAKTSSGKLRRQYMRDRWRQGDIVGFGEATLPASDAQQTVAHSPLMAMLQEKGYRPAPEQSLSMLGFDSLQRLEMHTRLERVLERAIPVSLLLDDLPLATLETNLAVLPVTPSVPDCVPTLAITPWQEAIWLHQELQVDTACYNLAATLSIDPALSVGSVTCALVNVATAHPQLCARLTGDGWQVTEPGPVDVIDTDGWSTWCRQAWIAAFRARPFNLFETVPWRCALLRQAQGKNQLVLVGHHIALDFNGAQQLLKDVQLALEGKPLAPAIPLDHALGVLHASARPEMRADPAWLAAIATAPDAIDFHLPAGRNETVASLRQALGRDEALALRQFAHENGITLPVLLSAAFAALLARYSEESCITLGIPVSVRPESLNHWVGNAVNILPLPLQISTESTISTLIAQAQEQMRQLLNHRFLPYTALLAQVRERDPQRSTLYHAVLSCPTGADADHVPAFIPGSAAQSAFSLLAIPTRDTLTLELEFDPAQCDLACAERLLAHLRQWLAEATPASRVAEINYLTLPEQARAGLLGCVTDVSTTCSIIAGFNQQLATQPDAIAVEDGEGQCSYQQLAALAGEYLHALRQRQVQPGENIGLSMPRNRHLPAAMLAIHAAGASYVPLDLAYPPARLALMLEDSQCRLVMTAEAGHFRDYAILSPVAGTLSQGQALPEPDQESVAYVLYTSGSTGRPKGVQVTHANVGRLLAWAQATFSSQERARVLASTSICFDLSVFELFVPICLGTCCVIVERVLSLADTPVDVSLINTVPSAIDALLQADAFPTRARVALVAGEPFRQALVERLLARHALPRLFDLYGPTEDTVYSTCAQRTVGGEETIGHPLPGTRAWILDENEMPVAEGLPGELWLAGGKLSRGYLARPELNEMLFRVPAVLAHIETRAYRTGDRVKRLPDGRLKYLGRRDHQIKLNGYRIETGEIERRLLAMPHIQQAVVGVVADALGQSQLTAWYVAGGDAPETAHFQQQLAQMMPVWMMPTRWMRLEALPQTPNGKTDRRALPIPDERQSTDNPLQGEHENWLATHWQSVLGVMPTRRDAHFISLGGNSLMAIQLRQRLNLALRCEVPAALVLNHRILSEQAQALAGWLESQASQDDVEEYSI